MKQVRSVFLLPFLLLRGPNYRAVKLLACGLRESGHQNLNTLSSIACSLVEGIMIITEVFHFPSPVSDTQHAVLKLSGFFEKPSLPLTIPGLYFTEDIFKRPLPFSLQRQDCEQYVHANI